MHEMEIAFNVLKLAERVAVERGATRVVAVDLRVGELSGVAPEALHFAFEAAREAFSRCAQAKLNVQWVPVHVRCLVCGHEGTPAPLSLACSGCGSPHTVVVAGEELEMIAVEVDVPPAATATDGYDTPETAREGAGSDDRTSAGGAEGAFGQRPSGCRAS